MLGSAYGLAGRNIEARQLLEGLVARRPSTYVPASALAYIYAGLQEPDQSLEWMARAVDERDPVLVTALKTAPRLDPLRSHPSYPGLLHSMNLEP